MPACSEKKPKGEEEQKADYATSVAKGVFVFKGKKSEGSPTKGKKAISKLSRKGIAKYAADKKRQPQTSRSATCPEYQATWSRASDAFAKIQKNMFSDVLDAITRFATNASPTVPSSFSGSSSSSSPSFSLIPTCALLTGVNLPDHEDLFRLLVTELRSSISPHVAAIKSSAGGTTLRAMVQTTVAQLMLIQEGEDNEEMDLKRANQVFPVLEAWYNNNYSDSAGERPPLIIILEDFEGFASHILQDFILNLVQYSSCLPIMLIFGVATTVTVIHKTIAHQVSSFLAIEKFSGGKATELLTKLVENVIIDDSIHFKLGGKVLGRLLEIFAFNDFSVKRFLSGYRYCLLEHFIGSPLTPLLCQPDPARSANIVDMNKEQLDRCRSLPSFRRYVEANIGKRAKLLLDDKPFKHFLTEKLVELDEASEKFNVLVSCLHVLTKGLPGTPFGRQMYSCYRTALLKPVVESHEYREAFQYLGMLSPTELKSKLEACLECLKKIESDEMDQIFGDTEFHLASLISFMEGPPPSHTPAAKAEQHNTGEKTPEQTSAANTPVAKKKKMDMAELKNQLLAATKEKKKQTSPYENIRKESLNFLHNLFKDHLVSPTTLPFHEIKFFERVSSVHRHLMPAPRAVIQTALEDPVHYLENSALSITDMSQIPPSFPDVGIAFKLHSECGRLINLYDWLQSYICVVDEDSGNNNGSADMNDDDSVREIDPALQARFTQAVSALQFLGFVKPSKRKTDHVQRLTWGGC